MPPPSGAAAVYRQPRLQPRVPALPSLEPRSSAEVADMFKLRAETIRERRIHSAASARLRRAQMQAERFEFYATSLLPAVYRKQQAGRQEK